MTLQESIATCIAKCFDFAGEASRSEFWWFRCSAQLVHLLRQRQTERPVLPGGVGTRSCGRESKAPRHEPQWLVAARLVLSRCGLVGSDVLLRAGR